MIEQEHTSQDWLEASRVCSVRLPITVSLGKQTSNIFHGESLNINENKVMGEKEDMKREGAKLLKEILNFSIKTPQGLLPLSWGCGQEPRHAGSGPKHLHMSLLGRRVLGNLRLSYTFWAPKESASVCAGLKTPARGPGSLVLSVWR